MHEGHDNNDVEFDSDAAERINDALDAIADGAWSTSHLRPLDAATAHTIDQFQRLASVSEAASAPDDRFVSALKEKLMLGTDAALPVDAPTPMRREKPKRSRTRSGREADRSGSGVFRISGWQTIEAAAILLVIVLAGTLLYGLRQPPPGPNHQMLAPQTSPSAIAAIDATPDATPGAATPVVATTTEVACDVAVTNATLDLAGEPTTETLLPWPTSGDRPAIQGWGALLPEEVPANLGAHADKDTVAAITTATSELLACVNDGDAPRTSALLSDDYLRRLNMLQPSEGGRTNQDSPRTLVPLAASAVAPIPAVHVSDVRTLPDGRVVASLTPDNVTESAVLQHFLYVFADIGGAWLVDEAIPVAAYPATEITVTDDGFSPNPVTVEPQRSKMMNLIVRNEGTTSHNLTIPQLNVYVEVAPGETQRVAVQLRSGVFAFISSTPGDIDAGLTGTLSIAAGIEPAGTPEPASPEAIIFANELMIVGETPVNLRSQPDAASEVITSLDPGTTVIVLHSPLASDPVPMSVKIDGEQWLFIQANDGSVGWIREIETEPAAR